VGVHKVGDEVGECVHEGECPCIVVRASLVVLRCSGIVVRASLFGDRWSCIVGRASLFVLRCSLVVLLLSLRVSEGGLMENCYDHP
jgi:hypothetical protein